MQTGQRFKKWLADNNVTVPKAAGELGCWPSHLLKLFSGRGLPGVKLAVDIEKMTKGEITPKHWVYGVEEKKETKEGT